MFKHPNMNHIKSGMQICVRVYLCGFALGLNKLPVRFIYHGSASFHKIVEFNIIYPNDRWVNDWYSMIAGGKKNEWVGLLNGWYSGRFLLHVEEYELVMRYCEIVCWEGRGYVQLHCNHESDGRKEIDIMISCLWMEIELSIHNSVELSRTMIKYFFALKEE